MNGRPAKKIFYKPSKLNSNAHAKMVLEIFQKFGQENVGELIIELRDFEELNSEFAETLIKIISDSRQSGARVALKSAPEWLVEYVRKRIDSPEIEN